MKLMEFSWMLKFDVCEYRRRRRPRGLAFSMTKD